MDIPWNPAVLEQRIARIHRLGQKSNVSVINFVSKGTIEHRMLDVLKFKTSLSQGIFDNGEDSIFLSDDKFNEFMKTIADIAEPSTQQDEFTSTPILDEEQLEQKELIFNEEKDTDINTIDDDEFDVKIINTDISTSDDLNKELPELDTSMLITQGISFIGGLAKTLSSPESTKKLMDSIIEKDNQTGKSYLKIPIENDAIVTNALKLIGQLFNNLSFKSK